LWGRALLPKQGIFLVLDIHRNGFYAIAVKPFSLPSFAKINLSLRVLGKREDGFHELFTVFQTVSLHDDITFADGDRIELTCGNKGIPTDEKNLVVRAANLLREQSRVRRGASIHLKKRIPSPGGLGGGSSNAAVALVGLSRLWELDLPSNDLHELAVELGSDVPFFLFGGTAIGTGTGAEIEPVADVEGKHLLVVTPNVHVSTKDAFVSLDAQSLTLADAERILIVCRFEAQKLDLMHSVLRNDIEAAVFAAYPEVERVKQSLLELGASNALMSGSGASVFAVFDKEETRQTALKALDREVNWRKFAVAAVSRAEYREKLGRAD
jgi:4-diphosphocytidyl-2-C-methyl-D-erythritol kinase